MSSATASIAARQPKRVPSHVPSGAPATDAIDQPMNTLATAPERPAPGTIAPAAAAACGVKTAAPVSVNTRSSISIA